MIITRYGTDIAIPLLIVSLLVIVGAMFLSSIWLKVLLVGIGSFAFLFTLNFFRDPERTTPHIDGGVISPADGRIVNISEVEEPEFIQGKAKQVCIFMSPLNVHVNRYPISGRVEFFRYVEGRYVMAFDDKSSNLNERTLIGIENEHQKVLFKQIAGFVARRIVCPIKVGDSAVVGERFGMIRFGSRVDVLMPPDADIKVSMNERVVAGETVLATVKR